MLAIVIKKAAILRQSEKGGPTKKLPICLVEQIVSKEFTRIPDDDGFVPFCRQSREIFTQVGMHDKKRPQVPTPKNSALRRLAYRRRPSPLGVRAARGH